MTPIENDESLLTAYALGELDAAERARVAAWVDADAAARLYVEQVRETAGVVAGGLAREHGDGLGLLHREVIERTLREVSRPAAAAAPPSESSWMTAPTTSDWMLVSPAASLTLAPSRPWLASPFSMSS